MENRISEFRRAHKWTQEHLAKLVSVSRREIQYWESGEHDPPLRTAFDLAELLGTTIEDLYPKALRD